MAFYALKPCNFGGFMFRIGEKVPDELVMPSLVRWFILNGYLAETPEITGIDNPEIVTPEAAESVKPEVAEEERAEPESPEQSPKRGKK